MLYAICSFPVSCTLVVVSDPLFRVEMRVSRDVTRLVLGDLQADRVYLVYVSSHVYRGDVESVRVLASGPSQTLPGTSVILVGGGNVCK